MATQMRATNTAFDGYLKRLSDELTSDGHAVIVFELREMDIKCCLGCLDCWVKTPGLCVTPDEARDVCRTYIHSDFVLCASPVIMGFYSALLKKMTDKLISLVHPYPIIVQGMTRHLARYDSYPQVGLLLEKSASSAPGARVGRGEARQVEVKVAVSNSFGLGDQNAVLALGVDGVIPYIPGGET